MQQKYFHYYLAIYFVAIALVASFLGGIYVNESWQQDSPSQIQEEKENGEIINKKSHPDYLSEDINFNLFWEVWDIVKEKHVDQPVSETKLLYGSLMGMVNSLGDPYSVFLDPETSAKFNQELSGTFEGIGAEIGIKKNQLTIVAPLPDTPAWNAGLKPQDNILAINGVDTTGMSLDWAVSLIRGTKGTEVVLTIYREGWDSFRDISIIRGTINVVSVNWEMKDDIAYVEINHFNEDTESKFNEFVQEISTKNSKGIILDLRNNPGGFLDTAIEVTSEWIEDGIVVIEEFSDSRKNEYKSRGRALLKGIPTVVLINEGSASGSEIVAGALQDYGYATLVGEKSYGKGSVQELETLSNGSSLKVTVAKWFTPLGRAIDGEGVLPDIEVELTAEDYENDLDPQLDKALELLR